MSRILIIVQARTESTRLPRKVLQDVLGEPMLVRQLERIARATVPARIVVATTNRACDEEIVGLCRSVGVEVFQGHPADLLDRHYQACRRYGASIVAKIPSDCPLIDPEVIDNVCSAFLNNVCDYASNLHPATYPDGNDVEVMSSETLAAAWREASAPWEREHTTPFIWERPQRFRLLNVRWQRGQRAGDMSMSHRWTVDYLEDYLFVRRVYQELYPVTPEFGIEDILDLLNRKPELAELNNRYAGVNWYRHHLNELKTITPDATRQMENA